MIFGEKKLKALLEGLRGDIKSDARAELDAALDRMEAGRQAPGKHDMVIQDMLDSWEEWQDRLRETAEKLEGESLSRLREEVRELRQRESLLLSAVTGYHEQVDALRRSAKGTAWEQQLELVEAKLGPMLSASGVQVVGSVGEGYNGALHEVLEVVPTDRPDQDLRVAEVYACGYLYRGAALKKAGVAVYQYRGEQGT